jgi:hypothetical protein
MVQFVFPGELHRLGSAAIFLIYGGPGQVAFVLPGWLLPGTKGKSLEELELVLGEKRKCSESSWLHLLPGW